MMQPIDWPKLLGDLQYLGLTGKELTRAAGVEPKRVECWARGATPCGNGARTLQLIWCELTGKSAQFLPRHPPGYKPAPAAKPVPGLDSDDDQEPAYVHIEQLQQIWNQSILRS